MPPGGPGFGGPGGFFGPGLLGGLLVGGAIAGALGPHHPPPHHHHGPYGPHDYQQSFQGVYTLNIISGSDLHNTQLVFTQDPYIIITLYHQDTHMKIAEIKTKHIKNGGVNPSFNYTLNFRIPDDIHIDKIQMDIRIRNNNVIHDDDIGQIPGVNIIETISDEITSLPVESQGSLIVKGTFTPNKNNQQQQQQQERLPTYRQSTNTTSNKETYESSTSNSIPVAEVINTEPSAPSY